MKNAGVYVGLRKKKGQKSTVTAITDCLVVTFELGDLNTIATRMSPVVASYWVGGWVGGGLREGALPALLAGCAASPHA